MAWIFNLKIVRRKISINCFGQYIGFSPIRRASLSTDGLSNYIMKSPVPDIDLPRITVNQLVWQRLHKWADKTAVVCGITGKSYDYKTIYKLSRCFASALRKEGLKKGDVLAVLLPNLPEYPIIVLGAVEVGVIISTLNPVYTPHEISHQLLNSNAKMIVTFEQFVPKVEEAKKLIESNLNAQFPLGFITLADNFGTTGMNRKIDFAEMLNCNDDLSSLNDIVPDDVVFLPYSSGTTGLPKGVQLTHFNIVSTLLQAENAPNYYMEPSVGDFQNIIPAVIPFFHIYGLVVIILSSLINGARIICLPKFDPQTYLLSITKHKSTILFVAPPLLLFLANHPSVKRNDLESVESVFCAGSAAVISDVEKLTKKMNRSVFSQGYGLTETSPSVIYSNKNLPFNSIGFPLPNTLVKVTAEDGTLLGPNKQGELCCKGPQIMKGYLNNEEATAQVMDTDGYFHTGDVGYFNEEGLFFMVDRKKELIKVKGFQVAPLELENVIKMHSAVLDAAVIGVPDDRSGEKPLAFVILHQSINKLAEKELLEFVAGKVAPYKQLKGVVYVDTIPKTPAGKMLKRVLKETYGKMV